MEAIKISLDDFVLSGGGFNGESYDHKTENAHHRTRHAMPHAAIPRSVVESLTMMGKKNEATMFMAAPYIQSDDYFLNLPGYTLKASSRHLMAAFRSSMQIQ